VLSSANLIILQPRSASIDLSASKALEDMIIDGPNPIGPSHDQALEEANELTVGGSPPLGVSIPIDNRLSQDSTPASTLNPVAFGELSVPEEDESLALTLLERQPWKAR
jgi:hypothetical protein